MGSQKDKRGNMNQQQKQLNIIRLLAYDQEMQDLVLAELNNLLKQHQDLYAAEFTETQLIDDLYENIWAAVYEDAIYNEESELNTKIQLAIPHGNSPYGYRIILRQGKSTLVPNAIEFEIVRLIHTWYLQHDYSLRDIANQLTELHLPTPGVIHKNHHASCESNQWDMTVIHTVVSSPTYVGQWQHYDAYHKKSVLTKVPPIITAEIHQRSQARLLDNRNRPQHALKYPYLLPLRVTCGGCGKPIKLHAQKLKGGIRQYYRCPTSKCETRGFRSKNVDGIVWNWLSAKLEDKSSHDRLQNAFQAYRKKKSQNMSIQMHIIKLYFEGYQKELKALLNLKLPKKLLSKQIQQYCSCLQIILSNLEKTCSKLVIELEQQSKGTLLIEDAQDDLQAKQRIISLIDVQVVISGRNHNQKIEVHSELGRGTLQYIRGNHHE